MIVFATIRHGCSITHHFYLRRGILASKGEFSRLHYLIIAIHAKYLRSKLLQYYLIKLIKL